MNFFPHPKGVGLADPFVSVVISNYNYQRYLGETIRSVLGQTYRNIEIIVVDDGSTDRSCDVISKFGNQVTPLYNDHRGQCAALNTGFSTSRGNLVIFLDSDDCLLSDALERFVRPFKENMAITKSQGYMIAVDTNGCSLERKIPPRLSPSDDYRNMALKQGPWDYQQAWTSGNMWARWFLEQVLPLPESAENRVFPDGCLNPLAVLYGPIVTLDKPVAYYRIHENNKGPIRIQLNTASLSMQLTRKRSEYEFVIQRIKKLGIEPPLERWFKGIGSWREKLMVYAISLVEPKRKPPQFHELVLAPFTTGKTGRLKATVLVAALTIVWISPRKLTFRMICRLLRAYNCEQ